MLSEVVRPWPFLVLLTAARDSASEVSPRGARLGMAASPVSFNIVRSAESFGAGAVGDVTVVRLRVLMLVLPSGALAKLQ